MKKEKCWEYEKIGKEKYLVVSLRDAEILKWHHAGKSHSFLETKFDVSGRYIEGLVIRARRGYVIRGDGRWGRGKTIRKRKS